MKAPVASLGRDRGWVWAVRSSELQRMCRSGFNNGAIVRFPQCDISAMTLLRQHIGVSFDHLVGGYEERIGHREAECLGGFEVDDQSVHRWLLKW